LSTSQGKYNEAEPLYRRAIAIDEKALGPDHPGLATDLNKLAELLEDQVRNALWKQGESLVTVFGGRWQCLRIILKLSKEPSRVVKLPGEKLAE